jgi:hypothetical protein
VLQSGAAFLLLALVWAGVTAASLAPSVAAVVAAALFLLLAAANSLLRSSIKWWDKSMSATAFWSK